MPRHKLIIDADPGIGDAVAIALALCDPTLDVVALTACGGLVSGAQAFCNLQTITSLLDPARWPRIGSHDAEAFRPEDSPILSGIFAGEGKHGLGECEPVTAPRHQPTDSSKLMVEFVRLYPGEVTLLTLGPLTNLLAATERDSTFLSMVKQIVICGGSISAGGDATAAAEFNILANPEAARSILLSAANKTMLPIDTTHQFGLSFDEYSQLGVNVFSPLGRLLHELIPFALRENRIRLGREGTLLPGVVAVAAISHPELFDQATMRVDVELTGVLTRGMTVFDRRRIPHWKENIEVMTAVDLLEVKDYMHRLIDTSQAES